MIVFDAGALIALLRLEPGALRVRRLLRDNPGACCIHGVNLCEIYYGFARVRGVAYAERALGLIFAIGVSLREDMDAAFLQEAGNIKMAHSLSLADAFGLALARRMDADFVTTDHHELDAVVSATPTVCRIVFIR